MSFSAQLRRLLDEPPPAYIFEISQAGIAWAIDGRARPATLQTGFRPLPPDAIAVSPVKDNVLRPEALEAEVRAVAPANGARRRRDAALILPDYCTRIVVLDFEHFPAEKNEQAALVRFRLKKTVPFDMEAAAVGYQARGAGKKQEVVIAATPVEVVARYEAPFRNAGFHPGFVTTSMLAALDLLPAAGFLVTAKLAGRVLTVAVSEGRSLKMLRCVELAELDADEVMGVLFPTFAYAEDELPARPDRLLLCGFGAGPAADDFRQRCENELRVAVEPLRSRFGLPDENSAGLHGYLQAQQGG